MDGVLTTSLPAPSALDALAGVAREEAAAAVERSLAAARELLGMQLAYIAEAGPDEFRFRAVDGDAAPFGGPAAGLAIPRADTLCDRMLRGAIDNVVPDVAAVPEAASAARSVGVGSYVGVPVRLVGRHGLRLAVLRLGGADPGAARARRAPARGAGADRRRPDRPRAACGGARRGSPARRPPGRRCSPR